MALLVIIAIVRLTPMNTTKSAPVPSFAFGASQPFCHFRGETQSEPTDFATELVRCSTLV